MFCGKTQESSDPQLSPIELTLLNAWRKARAVAPCFPDATVLAADTVVALGAQVFGKPESMAGAADMLRALVGRTHTVVTGVCLLCPAERSPLLDASLTEVTLKTLTDAEIRAYHDRIGPLDKAGAYSAQDHPEQVIAAVRGSFTNVVGLPMERVRLLLARCGIEPVPT